MCLVRLRRGCRRCRRAAALPAAAIHTCLPCRSLPLLLQHTLDEMDVALATADAERAQKTAKLAAAGEKARRLQRMLEEVRQQLGSGQGGVVGCSVHRSGYDAILAAHCAVAGQAGAAAAAAARRCQHISASCLPYEPTWPAATKWLLVTYQSLFAYQSNNPQVHASLAREREAREVAYKEKALIEIELEAKQRLAYAMREVRALCRWLWLHAGGCCAGRCVSWCDEGTSADEISIAAQSSVGTKGRIATNKVTSRPA